MGNSTIRIGFIGAGGIARRRHLPRLSEIEGVEVVAVSNRSRESSEKIAHEFGVPEVVEDWRRLVEREDIDAVFIGTWPYMHREMSVAALEAGLHVFCQARMAMNLQEAMEMVAAAESHPDLVSMICPPPHRMPFEPFVKHTISSGRLGEVVSVEILSAGGANLDRSTLSWREDARLSGNQILAVGIYAETLNAWLGPYDVLFAHTAIPITEKEDPSRGAIEVKIPQVVTIAGRLVSGALITEHHTGVASDGAEQLIIRGLEGSLRRRFKTETVEIALGGKGFEEVEVPPDLLRPWQVERDFIEAVRAARRGESWSVSPDFSEGLLYMRKTEAVQESARTGKPVKPALL